MSNAQLHKLIRKALKDAENEALDEGVDVTTPEFKEVLLQIRNSLLEKMGVSISDYEDYINSLKEIGKAKKLKKEQELDEKIQSVKEEVVKQIPEVVQPTFKSLPDKPNILTKEDVIKIVDEKISQLPKPDRKPIMQVNRNVVEKTVVKEEYNDTELKKELGTIKKQVENIKIPDTEKVKEEIRNEFGDNLKKNTDILGMPDWRKLAMGLQGQIDEVRNATPDLSGYAVINHSIGQHTFDSDVNFGNHTITANSFLGNLQGTASYATSTGNASTADYASEALTASLLAGHPYTDFVPYSGATSDVNIGTYSIIAGKVDVGTLSIISNSTLSSDLLNGDGNFDDPTDWSAGTGVVSGNALSWTHVDGDWVFYNGAFLFDSFKTYKVTYTVSTLVNSQVQFGDTDYGPQDTRTAIGTYTLIVTGLSGSPSFWYGGDPSTGEASVTNLTIVEYTDNMLSVGTGNITIDGNFYGSASTNKIWLGGTTDTNANLRLYGDGTAYFGGRPTFASTGAPFTVSSNTVVTSLNADYLDGLHATSFVRTTLQGDVNGNSKNITALGSTRFTGNSAIWGINAGAAYQGISIASNMYWNGSANVVYDSSRPAWSFNMQHGTSGDAFVINRTPAGQDPNTSYVNFLQINSTGAVGINTTSPLAKLDIRNGNASIGGALANIAFQYGSTGGYRHFISTKHDSTVGNGNAIEFFINNSNTSGGSTSPGTGNLNVMGIYGSGNIGIGTTSPAAKLHVISTTEQLRVGYDTNNYFSVTVGSTGTTTFNAVGGGAGFVFSDAIQATYKSSDGSAGASGTFTSADSKTITVKDGIITSIA